MKAKPQGRRVASTPGTQSTLRGGKKSVWGDEAGLVTRHGAGEGHRAFRSTGIFQENKSWCMNINKS